VANEKSGQVIITLKMNIGRIPHEPPKVNPVANGTIRPQWSVMIPVYNCARYLPEALKSVLMQALSEEEMQIEVVDDCSTDDNVAEIVDRVGKGRVKYFRQTHNVGSLWNFHTCITRANGYFIHLLHGDDRLRNGFYKYFNRFFSRCRDVGAAFCRYAYIDENGKFLYYQKAEMGHEGVLADWLTTLGERQRIQYVSIVVKREVYEALGTFYRVEYGEDWEMWMRIASRYKMGYVPTVLAEYRRHDNSISGKSFLTGRNMQELASVMENIQEYIPVERREHVTKTSKKFYAHYAVKTANALWKKFRHKSGAVAQVREAWRMSRDVKLLYKIIKLYTRITLNI
jgi:glycosyltransferase involved in cell wall biosynthesis